MSVNWKQRKYLMAERNSEKQNWHSTDNPLEISACDISEGSLAGENNRSILQLCQNFVSYCLCEKLKKSQQILNFCFYVTIFSKCFFFLTKRRKRQARVSVTASAECWAALRLTVSSSPVLSLCWYHGWSWEFSDWSVLCQRNAVPSTGNTLSFPLKHRVFSKFTFQVHKFYTLLLCPKLLIVFKPWNGLFLVCFNRHLKTWP